MSLEVHIDSVRAVVDALEIISLNEEGRQFKLRFQNFVLCLSLPSRFPLLPPTLTTLNGLPLYDIRNWNEKKLLGEEIKGALEHLSQLRGNLNLSVDLTSIKAIVQMCDHIDILQDDSLSRKTILLDKISSAASISKATLMEIKQLEEGVSRVEGASENVKELTERVAQMRQQCTPVSVRFPKGLGSRDGIRNSLLSLQEEKSRLIGDLESSAMRKAGVNQNEFDSELSRLLLSYKELHTLELQSKLLRSL